LPFSLSGYVERPLIIDTFTIRKRHIRRELHEHVQQEASISPCPSFKTTQRTMHTSQQRSHLICARHAPRCPRHMHHSPTVLHVRHETEKRKRKLDMVVLLLPISLYYCTKGCSLEVRSLRLSFHVKGADRTHGISICTLQVRSHRTWEDLQQSR